MLRVRDIMTTGVFTLNAEASAEEAAWALTRRHISGAPVRDRDGNLIGVLSKSDLVDPAPADWAGPDPTVEDLMTPEVGIVSADAPAETAAHLMAERRHHRVVALGEDGRPSGIVTAMDIVRALARGDFAEAQEGAAPPTATAG
jgi:CBS domain-containing protein